MKIKVVKIFNEKPHKCSQCDTRFTTKKNMYRHIREQHSSERYECVICHQILLNKGNYKVHYQRAHKDEFLLYMEPQKVAVIGNCLEMIFFLYNISV